MLQMAFYRKNQNNCLRPGPPPPPDLTFHTIGIEIYRNGVQPPFHKFLYPPLAIMVMVKVVAEASFIGGKNL